MRLVTRTCFTVLTILVATATYAADAPTFMGLTIEPESNSDTYDRDEFKHWTDFDDDDESTRQEVLITESLAEVTFRVVRGQRKVQSGLWAGPYTGLVTKNPSQLQIDHMVPLKETWESGAHAWTDEERETYANDLDLENALIAVKGGSNGSKGARDPAEWFPPNRAYWCSYLTSWVSVKQKYELSVDQDEADALEEGFRICGKYRSGDSLDGRH